MSFDFLTCIFLLVILNITEWECPSSTEVLTTTRDIEVSISREIRLNESLRGEILGTSGTIDWNDFPSQTKNKIIDKTPKGLECVAKICPPGSACLLEEESEKNIYAHSILIFSTLTNYNPRIVKLFCNY